MSANVHKNTGFTRAVRKECTQPKFNQKQHHRSCKETVFYDFTHICVVLDSVKGRLLGEKFNPMIHKMLGYYWQKHQRCS